jgi:uncharacterized protein
MKNRKIILAGGTGFIGQEIIRCFGKENEITVLTRQLPNAANNRNHYTSLSEKDLTHTRYIKWDGQTAGSWAPELNNADLIINLAGKSVNCRYTNRNKQEILSSRIDAVKAIGRAIQQCTHPPKLWINASSATIYRHAADRPQDEYSGEYGQGFSVDVCQAWEKIFYEQDAPATRKVALRMAITLGSGGVLIPYFNLLKFGLGGKQGNGQQRFSWVHINDTCRMIEWIAENEHLTGTYNCSSPAPVTNTEFMQALRKATRTRRSLPAPAWLLKAGAVLTGTETELVLKSRWVLPARILETGFTFNYPLLPDALTDILSAIPPKQYRFF